MHERVSTAEAAPKRLVLRLSSGKLTGSCLGDADIPSYGGPGAEALKWQADDSRGLRGLGSDRGPAKGEKCE